MGILITGIHLLKILQLTTNTSLGWGVCATLAGVCKNYGGLVTVRFFLGLFGKQLHTPMIARV